MRKDEISRRLFVKASAFAAGSVVPAVAFAKPAPSPSFAFEVTHTDTEWRNRLSEHEFQLLRQGETEAPKSHPYWKSEAAGQYACRGCQLPLFESHWKVLLDKGWAFFQHSLPTSVLTEPDRFVKVSALGASDEPVSEKKAIGSETAPMIEALCRRCASHLGHVVSIDQRVLYCVNGGCLTFVPAAT